MPKLFSIVRRRSSRNIGHVGFEHPPQAFQAIGVLFRSEIKKIFLFESSVLLKKFKSDVNRYYPSRSCAGGFSSPMRICSHEYRISAIASSTHSSVTSSEIILSLMRSCSPVLEILAISVAPLTYDITFQKRPFHLQVLRELIL